MHYVVLFEDNPGHDDTRAANMPAHLAFIEANAGAFRAAGPLFEAGLGAGGMWLVEGDSRADVAALTEADPFFATGMRKTIRVLEWRRVYADGARRV